MEPVVHGGGINPEGERATVNQRPVVLRPVGDGVKRCAHDADLKGMVVIRSPRPQLVPFKLHRFGKQRQYEQITDDPMDICPSSSTLSFVLILKSALICQEVKPDMLLDSTNVIFDGTFTI
ncbi:hypothetical protein [Aeromonas sp. MrichA-1]|uniref:hypothetical protein n=1 Tax=Aeromonas sp. MrichA-1 TaxID=2823362 RepID=UPI001B3318ED|nr:hypothetical protein [Aeromonas sp. MrichA-1]MBP4077979.1 hypothetical protein [Aeromonas sp. MrichA-1]